MALVAGTGVFLALGIDGDRSGGGRDGDRARGPEVTPTTQASATGRPCVPVTDPLPAGAPEVPVEVGPPPQGLLVRDLEAGTGAEVTPGDTVTVHYVGVACSTGRVFDSSYQRSQPATFPLGGVIPGWRDGLVGMKVGGTRLLGVPPDAAYGSEGFPPAIGPDETLWFVVRLVATTSAPAGP